MERLQTVFTPQLPLQGPFTFLLSRGLWSFLGTNETEREGDVYEIVFHTQEQLLNCSRIANFKKSDSHRWVTSECRTNLFVLTTQNKIHFFVGRVLPHVEKYPEEKVAIRCQLFHFDLPQIFVEKE